MAGFKLTGIGAATGNGQAIRYEQVGTLVAAPGPNSDITSLSALTSINGDGMLGRNLLINSNFRRSPDNGTSAVTPTTNAYISDGWAAILSQASKLTFQQVTDAPNGFSHSMTISVAAQYSPGATDQFLLYQPIEGQLLESLAFGTISAKSISTGKYIKGSVAGTYAVSIRNGASNRSYVGTISVTTSWAEAVIENITGDTTGTWATNNTVGCYWAIDLGSGSNYSTTAGAWQAGNYTRTSGSVTFVNQVNGSTLYITGAQLEVGAKKTQWKPHVGIFGGDDATCLRYYYQTTGATNAEPTVYGYSSSGTFGASFKFPVPMRVTPTASVTGTFGVNNIPQPTVTAEDVNSYLVFANSAGAGQTSFQPNGSAICKFSARL